jgi:glycosyltransferase involved in cell wall biosynthesis
MTNDSNPLRVAVVAGAVAPSRGLARTLARLADDGLPGHAIEPIAAGAGPFAVSCALAARDYDLVHACGPGPAALAAMSVARTTGIPIAAGYDAEPRDEPGLAAISASFYGRCDLVLSPSAAADASLERLGVGPERVRRWAPGVDFAQFSPARYCPEALPPAVTRAGAQVNVLYVGRLSSAEGTELLADAFLLAHDRDPRLHLVLAGDGPERARLARRLGSAATFLDRLGDDALAATYATADLLAAPGGSDVCGLAILEAQASGLPVLAVDAGVGPELIESGRSGCLVAPFAPALAEAISGLARRATLRDRLATGGLLAVRERTLERSLAELAAGWAAALAGERTLGEVVRAA